MLYEQLLHMIFLSYFTKERTGRLLLCALDHVKYLSKVELNTLCSETRFRSIYVPDPKLHQTSKSLDSTDHIIYEQITLTDILQIIRTVRKKGEIT